MAVGVVVSDLPPVTLVAEVQDVFQHDAAQVLRGPGPQRGDALREAAAVGSAVGVPDALRDLREPCSEMLGSVPDLQPTVEKALHDGDLQEKGFPGRLRAFPAVGVHALRSVLGVHVQGFLAKNAVSLSQFLGSGTLGDCRTQTAPPTARGGA